MDLVRAGLFVLLLTATAALPAHACDLERWQSYIAEATRRYVLPESWIRAVMRAESAGCTRLDGRPTTSPAGAMGLMQLMPATWAELRQRYDFGADPYAPRDNILAGAAYMREMVDRFGVPGAFAAYHAGPARYAAHVGQGGALPLETRRYLAQVSAAVGIEYEAAPVADALFAVIARAHTANGDKALPPDPRLFVRLRRDGTLREQIDADH